MADMIMDSIEVFVSKVNHVVIKQDSALRHETEHVMIHSDQVDTVIRWLQQAKAEALEKIAIDEERARR